MKISETGKVVSQKEIAKGIFDLVISTKIAELSKPGQFVMVYPKDGTTILPRPISIAEVTRGEIRLVYRVVGKGTNEFSGLKAGDAVRLLGSVGNGFPLEKAVGKRAVLMGGGIGVPPILELSKELPASSKIAVLGYRDNDLFLKEDFDKYIEVKVATEDGSAGTRGNVLDVLRAEHIECDVIYACGPMPMLRAIKKYAEEKNIEAFISLEERMACGVGACLGCVVKTKEKDHHSNVNNARICTEGPVFDAREVEI